MKNTKIIVFPLGGLREGRRKLNIPPFILFLMLTFLFIVIYSMLAPVLHPIDLGATNITSRLKPPSIFGYSDSGHLLGTDYLGRDVAIRLVYATRSSLSVSFSGTLLAALIGITMGVLAGLNPGWVDDLVGFLINARQSIPSVLMGIIVATIFGSSTQMMIILIGFVGWTRFARYTRAQVIQIRSENFIECSRAIGASTPRIFAEHILVNIASPLIVTATLNLSSNILLENTLSFLGLGIQPPQTSLGVMVSSGRNHLMTNWWLAIAPSAMIVIIILIVSLVGDWLRDRLDPKLQRNR